MLCKLLRTANSLTERSQQTTCEALGLVEMVLNKYMGDVLLDS